MTKLMLSLHVLASILTIGPITVAASMFPRFVTSEGSAGGAALLHRICRGYTVVGIAVPVFGLATGAHMGVLGDAWLIASIILTTAAAALLVVVILPGQRRLLDGDSTATSPIRLTMTTGMFNLLWATVVVLMIIRPGSTTGT
ncbi:hypothetical protein [Actinokineospora globicatena]|uniref:Membrane protein n=1 Tax=Actinokineospora globicatena TaxID=103729 RepID=A0A9W6QJF6_9PSEU|nr:hypothetical protein [Actinokineospora globicatena]GLW91166.1 membrane protein [Actinokineospora globicatena]